jgi:N-acetylglucosamine-6-phosphate deacetylase
MARKLIENATLVLSDRKAEDHSVLLEGGRIVRIGRSAALGGAVVDERVDAGGDFLAPGFIDLHIHGTGAYSVDDGPDALAGLCRLLPQYGVSGFLPTVAPRPQGEDASFLSALAATAPAGAQILGFHLEGPFLALTGALPKDALGGPDSVNRVERLVEASRPYPAVFSVSPDFEGILDLIPLMSAAGAPVFMTHTQATVEQTIAAIEAGVRHATHFYDVFPVPTETEPGVRPCGAVEAILADPRVTVDFILDGEHVHPVACRLALACKGVEGVALISDAIVGAGLPPGKPYRFGDYEFLFAREGGPARMTERGPIPGALVGGGLTLDAALRNAVTFLNLRVEEAVALLTSTPARILGLEKRKGRLAEGYDADLVRLSPDLKVMQCWIGGEPQLQSGVSDAAEGPCLD